MRYQVFSSTSTVWGQQVGVEDRERSAWTPHQRGRRRRVRFLVICLCRNPGIASLIAAAMNDVPQGAAQWQDRYQVFDGRQLDDHMVEVRDLLREPVAVTQQTPTPPLNTTSPIEAAKGLGVWAPWVIAAIAIGSAAWAQVYGTAQERAELLAWRQTVDKQLSVLVLNSDKQTEKLAAMSQRPVVTERDFMAWAESLREANAQTVKVPSFRSSQ